MAIFESGSGHGPAGNGDDNIVNEIWIVVTTTLGMRMLTKPPTQISSLKRIISIKLIVIDQDLSRYQPVSVIPSSGNSKCFNSEVQQSDDSAAVTRQFHYLMD